MFAFFLSGGIPEHGLLQAQLSLFIGKINSGRIGYLSPYRYKIHLRVPVMKDGIVSICNENQKKAAVLDKTAATIDHLLNWTI